MARYTHMVLIAAAFCVVMPAISNAHPHVFVDTTFVPVSAGDRLSGIRTTWRFDPIYSDMVLADADTDGDGRLNASERDVLTSLFFTDLPDYGFLTRVGVDGEWLQISEADEYWVDVQDGILSAGFTLRVDLPVEVTLEMISFDDEYFIAYEIAEEAVVQAQASAEWQCAEQRYDMDSWYFGPVTGMGISCERIGNTS